jgi:CBS domain containing-hemolysin-like protein
MNLIIIISTLLASAFFSGIEIAFVSANRLKIELDKKQGVLSGKILGYFVKNSPKFISTLLLGNNVALVMYGIYMALALEPSISSLPYMNEASVLLIQTIASTLIVLITAEFLPKAIFRINPNRTLSLTSLFLMLVYILLFIPTFITTIISKGFLKVFRIDISSSEQAFTKVDLDDYVSDVNERLDAEAEMKSGLQLLDNAKDFGTKKVRDCMVPRTEILALNIDDSIDYLKGKFSETGYSKVMIFRDDIDNIIGYVHSFELFKKPETIKQILLPISIVPEASLIEDVLEQFTQQKRSIAVVVDEFGGTSGLITVEDIIEEIFGEIEDEHDGEDLLEKELKEGEYLFSARHEIDYINDKFKLKIEESDEYTTLAGFVLDQLEEIPQKGDSFQYKKYLFEITQVSNTKIEEVCIKEQNS